jgi:transglutaminase-like putative cysteine protease
MSITVRAHLHYQAAQPCDLLLQIEALTDPWQRSVNSTLAMRPECTSYLIEGEDGIGVRRWVKAEQTFVCYYEATFEIDRPQRPMIGLPSAPVSQTPACYTKYLMPSRYCHPEASVDLLQNQFAGISGGALVMAVCEWINKTFSYDIFASNAGTTATDSLAARAGVCRDYAHVLIAMARAAGIPARYVSAYAPDVHPQDFHAVAEVYLDGTWLIVDPTGMAKPCDIIRIGVGRDAADVSFMTSYGFVTLVEQTVEVHRAKAALGVS